MDTVIPPGKGIAFIVRTGDRVRITDVEGQQVADLVSFRRDDPGERLGMYPSRAVNGTWKLTAGHVLQSNRSRPLWAIEEDSVGENYGGGGFCNGAVNRARYGTGDEPNCLDNFLEALRPHGLTAADIDFDACFNVFMTVTYEPDGRWEIREPRSRAGDHITLRALAEQIVAISNCPQLRNPVNAFRLKPLRVEVIEAGER